VRTLRRLLIGVGVTTFLVAPATAAAAHPLGNFTTNTYAGLEVGVEDVAVDYVLDLAEIPTFQTIERLGRGPDGRLDTRVRAHYEAGQCADLAAGLQVTVDGERFDLDVVGSELSFPAGEAGLDTLRLECRMLARAGAFDGQRTVTISDGSFPSRLGWREITATGDGTTVTASDVPSTSLSARLLAYPEELQRSPLDRREATVRVRRGGPADGAGAPSDPGESMVGAIERLSTSFTSLVAGQPLTVAFGLFAFGAAILLGALHALAPGHGKTVMAAYLVGSRGTTRQALQLGMTVAVTHTAGVFALGMVLSAFQSVAPERVYPYLGLASGLLFSAVGAVLLRNALRARKAHHSHDHGHSHEHGHTHEHGHEHGHTHDAALTWRSMLAPGLAGGLVPSPSALVVLLGGIAVGRAWFGVSLVFAYGVGMAATLVAAGYLLLRARHRFESRTTTGRLSRLVGALPVGTAGLIVVGGLVIAARSAIPL